MALLMSCQESGFPGLLFANGVSYMLISDPKEFLLRVESKSAYIGAITVCVPEIVKVG